RNILRPALRFFGMRDAICLAGSSRHSIFQPSLFYQSETSTIYVALAVKDSRNAVECANMSGGPVGYFCGCERLV
ncbi:hypothetical protein TGMAS_417840, partial [Toxoplasma gondii MAS]